MLAVEIGQKCETDLLPILTSIGIYPELIARRTRGRPHAQRSKMHRGADSQLLGKAALEEYRESLANIFKFRVVDGQLKDRPRGVETNCGRNQKRICRQPRKPPKPKPKLARQNPQAALQMQQALIVRQLALRSSITPVPPLILIFEKIKEQAQRSSHGFGSGGPAGGGVGDRVRWQSSFTGDVLSGTISTTNESENISLQEVLLPRRQLEFRTDAGTAFSLKLTNREGDLISLRQERSGRFSVVALLGDNTFADQRDSFAAFIRANRRLASNELLPALVQFGFEPILSPDSPGVRHAVIASLLSADEIQAEGKRLIADLNSDDYDTRERASQSLAHGTIFTRTSCKRRLTHPSNSPEVQARLNAVSRHSPSALRRIETATALDLGARSELYHVAL